MHSFRQSDYLAIRTAPEIMGLTFDTESMMDYYQILRYQLAKFFAAETTLLFPDGFMAFVALLRDKIQDGDLICLFPHTHAAIWDALEIIQRIRNVSLLTLQDNTLGEIPKDVSRVVLVAMGVDPTEGILVPAADWYTQLQTLYQKRGIPSLFLLEDSHGVGVLGENGRGTFDFFGIPSNVLNGDGVGCFFSGSLDKALGTSGGFLVGERRWLKRIHKSDPCCCTRGQFPLSVAVATVHAIELASSSERRNKMRENQRILRRFLQEAQIPFLGDERLPFVLIPTSKVDTVLKNMETKGFSLGKAHFTKESALRIAVHADHTPDVLQTLVQELSLEFPLRPQTRR